MIGAARVLHRRDEPAAVAVRTGVAAGVPLRVSRPRRSSLLLLGKRVRWPSLLPLSPERYRFSGAVVASALSGPALLLASSSSHTEQARPRLSSRGPEAP